MTPVISNRWLPIKLPTVTLLVKRRSNAHLDRATPAPVRQDRTVARQAQTKNGFAPRACAACGRPFEWRKKWARDWDNVRWCSDACRRGGSPSRD